MAEAIREIKEKLQAADYERLPDLFKRYEQDERNGVRLEVEKARCSCKGFYYYEFLIYR